MCTSTVPSNSSQWSKTFSNAALTFAALTERRNQRLSRFFRLGFAQQKDDFARFVRREFDVCLDSGAGIESGAVASGETDASERRGRLERTVAADKLFAIARRTRESFTRRHESDPLGELVVVGIAREDRRRWFVDLGDDVGRGYKSGPRP